MYLDSANQLFNWSLKIINSVIEIDINDETIVLEFDINEVLLIYLFYLLLP